MCRVTPLALLSGKSGQATLADGMGSAVFGDRLELGHRIKQDQLDSLQEVLDRFRAAQR